MVALIETYQEEGGRVGLPEVLQEKMGVDRL
jgi:seryl-tRNA synthetase